MQNGRGSTWGGPCGAHSSGLKMSQLFTAVSGLGGRNNTLWLFGSYSRRLITSVVELCIILKRAKTGRKCLNGEFEYFSSVELPHRCSTFLVHTRMLINKWRNTLRSWVSNKAMVASPPSQLGDLLNEWAGCRWSRGVSWLKSGLSWALFYWVIRGRHVSCHFVEAASDKIHWMELDCHWCVGGIRGTTDRWQNPSM